MNNKIRRIIKNPYVFSVISKFCMVLLGFLYTVCQSRYLGVSLKGDVSYITSVTSITAIVFGLGVHQAYPYFKKRGLEDVSAIFVKLSVAMLGIYSVIAMALIIILRADFTLGAILLLTPALVYHRIVAYICMVEDPNRRNLTEMLATFAEIIVVIVLWIAVPPTLFIGMLIYAMKDILLCVVYTYRLRASLFAPIRIERSQWLEILKFGIFPMLVLLMSTLNYRIDVIMLRQYVTSAELGIYSVGVMLAERVWIIPDALKEVMISNLAKGKGTDEVSFVIRVCNTACLIVVLGIISLGQPFINLAFGLEYSAAYSITIVILIGVIFMVYYKMIAAYNIVQGKQKENFFYLVISVVGNVIANAILIPSCGNLGAATASILSYAISAFLFTRRFIKETGSVMTDMIFINKGDLKRLKFSLMKKEL